MKEKLKNISIVVIMLCFGCRDGSGENYPVDIFFNLVRNNKYEDVRKLLDNGQNVNVQDRWGTSALHESIRSFKMCKLLIDSGIYVNLQKIEGTERYTALHLACMSKCDQGVVKLLLESGADPTITDMYGKTPLDYAIENSKAAQPWAKSFLEKVELIQSHLRNPK